MTNFIVTAVSGNTLTIAPALDMDYPAGTVVGVSAVNVTLASPAGPTDTVITVTDTTGIVPGMMLAITDVYGNTVYRTVLSVSGNDVTLAAPLGGTFGAGSGASQAGGFLTGMSIFDKVGNMLGIITEYTINDPRSFAIGEPGSMTFYLPRNSPDIALIKSDRLVAVSNNVGLPLWVGTITTQEWSGSTGNIHCEDAFSLLVGVPIEVELEVLDDTPATAIYKHVIDLVNARRGLDGEIQWGMDFSGTKPFLGDFEFNGDPDDAIRTIADRSGTEFAWRGSISEGRLQLFLVVRDAFNGGTGVPLVDGPGGNVVASPTYQVDPTTIINGIRITGDQTDLKRYVEGWAEWAIHDIEPSVEVYADTGDFRRRIDLDISVDFSLSKRTQRSLARRTADEVWGLYERYLYAIHDMQGRINHPGWLYEGPPENLEPQLTRDKWHTHRELARFRAGRPAAIVMESANSWLLVTYDITYSFKRVDIFGKESTYRPKQAYIKVRPGTHTLYDESGSRAFVYGTYTNSGTETWIVSLDTVTARLPNGSRITLRAIRSPTEVRGRYYNVADKAFYDFDPFDPIENVDTEGSQVGHIWPIERGQIREWDPRRDGIGARLVRTTVYSGRLTTRERWHVVPYSTGEEAETQLARGIASVDTGAGGEFLRADVIYVESGEGFPLDDLPFDIIVGDPLVGDEEIMRVWRTFGNKWHVERGKTITAVKTTSDVGVGATVVPVDSTAGFVTAMRILIGSETVTVEEVGTNHLQVSTPLTKAHAAGTTVTTSGYVYRHPEGSQVRLLYGVQFDGFKYPYTWPEGEEYARNLLARLSLPSRTLALNVANENDDWSSFRFGSTHTINIQSEGPPGGVTGTARCIAFSPNENEGTMEVILELLA